MTVEHQYFLSNNFNTTMKTFIVLCIFAVLGCNAQYGRSMNDYQMSSLKHYMQDRRIQQLTDQLEDACPGSKSKFEDSYDSFKSCVNEIDETQDTSCNIAQNEIGKCFKPMLKVFDDCLPDQSRGLPQMFWDALISGTKYLCKTDGEHVFELSNTCVYKSTPKSDRCMRLLRAKVQRFRTKMPSKQEVCDLFETFQPCWISHVNQACGHPVTRDTWIRFAEELREPCKPYLSSKNSVYEIRTTEKYDSEVESF